MSTSNRFRILNIAGARPNFMKVAPLVKAFRARPDIFDPLIIHTGQHYDRALSDVFFEQLGIPEPDVNLNVGSGTHAQQTAGVMLAFEPLLSETRPDLVLVVGDVNSTLACTLVAAKCGVPIAHVEAGLRSRDRSMPEEINRVLTDQISDLLFTTERTANDNLVAEGVDPSRIHFVGNVMIDTLIEHRERARRLAVHRALDVPEHGYVLMTLHRPSNVDDARTFDGLMEAVAAIAAEYPVLFPVHPRTRAIVNRSTIASALITSRRLRLLDPLGYLEFLSLMEASRAVVTDSGGVQEETTILEVPCLTLRTSTERPITLTAGTNQLVGIDPAAIVDGFRRAMRRTGPRIPELWDGRAAERIADVLGAYAAARRS
jgi:UDP-N-acetylglucosamine 2-epimerase (non-hydrolysing)